MNQIRKYNETIHKDLLFINQKYNSAWKLYNISNEVRKKGFMELSEKKFNESIRMERLYVNAYREVLPQIISYKKLFIKLTSKNPIKIINKNVTGFNAIFVHNILPYLYDMDDMKRRRKNALNRCNYYLRERHVDMVRRMNLHAFKNITEEYMMVCIYSAIIMNDREILKLMP